MNVKHVMRLFYVFCQRKGKSLPPIDRFLKYPAHRTVFEKFCQRYEALATPVPLLDIFERVYAKYGKSLCPSVLLADPIWQWIRDMSYRLSRAPAPVTVNLERYVQTLHVPEQVRQQLMQFYG